MQRDMTYLADILDSARLAIGYLQGVEWARFAADVQLQDSVIRRLEVIGEAARRGHRPPGFCHAQGQDQRGFPCQPPRR